MRYKRYNLVRENLSINDVALIEEFRKHSLDPILIEVENTRGMTHEMIDKLSFFPAIDIQVTLGYTKGHNERFGNFLYTKEKNIYNLQSMLLIIEARDEILKSINKEASTLVQVYKLYKRLIRELYYHVDGRDDLLGLISYKASSLGISFIFKDLLDNLNIPNRMIFLKDKRSAINAIMVGNHEILMDLGRDVYSKGLDFKAKYFGAMDLNEYFKLTPPAVVENVKDYSHFTRLTDVEINKLNERIMNQSVRLDYKVYDRDDGGRFVVASVDVHKYLYLELGSQIKNFRLVYSDIDTNELSDDQFKELFKRENLQTESNHLTDKTKVLPKYKKYLREDSQFILEELVDLSIFRYNYYSVEKLEDNTLLFEKKILLSDNDIFTLNEQDVAQSYLTKKRIIKSDFYNGYLGYIK